MRLSGNVFPNHRFLGIKSPIKKRKREREKERDAIAAGLYIFRMSMMIQIKGAKIVPLEISYIVS